MLAANYFAPDDSPLRACINALKTLTTQIQGIDPTLLYDNPPDSAPEDGSVMYLPMGWEAQEDAIGRLRNVWTFSIEHCFRRIRLEDAYVNALQYVMPWQRALAAWPNQDLGGVTILLANPKGKLFGTTYANTPLLVIANTVTLTTEEPIITS